MGHGFLRRALFRQHEFTTDAYEQCGPERTQYGA
jgi:hypothetical protein